MNNHTTLKHKSNKFTKFTAEEQLPQVSLVRAIEANSSLPRPNSTTRHSSLQISVEHTQLQSNTD